jgi:ribosomal protein S10
MEIRINTVVVITPDEIKELCKQEFIRVAGPVPAGYHLNAWDYYGSMKVETDKDEEPAPVPNPLIPAEEKEQVQP